MTELTFSLPIPFVFCCFTYYMLIKESRARQPLARYVLMASMTTAGLALTVFNAIAPYWPLDSRLLLSRIITGGLFWAVPGIVFTKEVVLHLQRLFPFLKPRTDRPPTPAVKMLRGLVFVLKYLFLFMMLFVAVDYFIAWLIDSTPITGYLF
ncbi:MAG: hypothetical protein QGD94_04340 [Planctomycetia bacterium]|nr:hypothetical protein [Planctomycetia bacterium]